MDRRRAALRFQHHHGIDRVAVCLGEIEKQSAQRLRKHESAEVPTVLIAMLFDAPDDDGAGNGARTGAPAHRSRHRAPARIGD